MSSPPSWWKTRNWTACLLYPASLLFGWIVRFRRHARVIHGTPGHLHGSGSYDERVAGAGGNENAASDPGTLPVPVIVVGNISVGGTGKSPLVAHLVALLRARGHRPGIVSRGYGGAPQREPAMVDRDSDPAQVGDEPVMHARLNDVPVCVCVDRPRAVVRLTRRTADARAHTRTDERPVDVDIVISDDGLQHYAMARTVEIVVVDGERGFGNGWLLPAGPLREPVSRLRLVDLVAVQASDRQLQAPDHRALPAVMGSAGVPHLSEPSHAVERSVMPQLSGLPCTVGSFVLRIEACVNLATGELMKLSALPRGVVHAVTGLGNPRRFFGSLRAAGFSVIDHAFDDHHRYTADELNFDDRLPVLVTSKDAVKIERLGIALDRFVEVRVGLHADAALAAGIEQALARLPLPESHAIAETLP